MCRVTDPLAAAEKGDEVEGGAGRADGPAEGGAGVGDGLVARERHELLCVCVCACVCVCVCVRARVHVRARERAE